MCGKGFSMIIGRQRELRILQDDYREKRASIVAIYGRRRIGKSHLIEVYGSKKMFWRFEGLEGQETKEQIKAFQVQLNKFVKDEFLINTKFFNWDQLLRYFTSHLKKQDQKLVLFLDEFQWLSAGQSKLVSLIKHFWDTEWKHLEVQMILCGSIASFMVDKVIKSKALYGRIDIELLVKELAPKDQFSFLKPKRTMNEALQYGLLLGGVPKYYEIINQNQSFDLNIQKLCFESQGYLFNEFEKIFYSQFKEHRTYEKIIGCLSTGVKSLDEIAKSIKIVSGGGLKRYLKNLELARFIMVTVPINKSKSNQIKYKLFDEFLIFYFKFIRPFRSVIMKNDLSKIFQTQVKPKWYPWLGLAFENYCSKYHETISNILEINDQVIDVGPFFERGDHKFQIDLLFKRSDKVWTLCECKYRNSPIGAEVIAEVERRVSLFPKKRDETIEKVLIAPNGADRSLIQSKYFSRIITIDDLLT